MIAAYADAPAAKKTALRSNARQMWHASFYDKANHALCQRIGKTVTGCCARIYANKMRIWSLEGTHWININD